MTSTTREFRLELHARQGRAVLVDARRDRAFDASRARLPGDLVEALHEWAHVVEALPDGGAAEKGSAARLVSRRGRQLAVRLAEETGGAIGYADPVSGRIAGVDPVGDRPRQSGEDVREPTPWATGLTVSGIIAGMVTVALTIVSVGLAEVSFPLAVLVNIVVAAGFAPSIWLGRRTPVWRWVAFGTAAGIGLAWFALLLSTLG